MTAGVWLYAGWLWMHDEVITHGQRYLMYVLGALADLGLVPAAIAIVMGSVGLVRRGVGRSWRFRAGLAVALGAAAVGATFFRMWLASRGDLAG